jgi:hypothetical protein
MDETGKSFDAIAKEYRSTISVLKDGTQRDSESKLLFLSEGNKLLNEFNQVNQMKRDSNEIDERQFNINNNFYNKEKEILENYIIKIQANPSRPFSGRPPMLKNNISYSGETGKLTNPDMGGKKKRKSRKRKSKKRRRKSMRK